MEAIVKKWGNSLGVRIPNLIARELSLKNGSPVDIRDNGKEIVIRPVHNKKLSEILNKITKENLHTEIQTGSMVGKEVW